MRQIYCGCYGNGGIYKVNFEDGILSDPVLFSTLTSTKYLAQGNGYLASLYSEGKKSGVAILAMDGKVLTSLPCEDVASCFIGCESDHIYTANFHEGTFSFLKYEDSTLSLERKIRIREKAGCHMLLRCRNLLLGFVLYLDRIFLFDDAGECLDEIVFPQGTGPRHGVLSEDEKYLYVISELSREVFIIETSSWKIIDKVKLSNDEGATAAAIRLCGHTLYVSIRGIDKVFEIAVNGEKLTVTKSYSCGGKHPRDMIVCDGYVLCANTHSNTLTCVNEKGTVSQVEIPEAVTLVAL